MDVFRTPDERFEGLPGYDFEPHYAEVDGLRLHYVDEGEGAPGRLLPRRADLGLPLPEDAAAARRRRLPRRSAPTTPGFGRSDKPTDRGWYSYDRHCELISGLLAGLDLQRRGRRRSRTGAGAIGLRWAVENADRVGALVIMNTGIFTGRVSKGFLAWRDFAEKNPDLPVGFVVQGGTTTELPDERRRGLRGAVPDRRVEGRRGPVPAAGPDPEDDPVAVHAARGVADALGRWDKPVLLAFSDSDPVFPFPKAGERFIELIPTADEQVRIEGAAHFLQEDRGEQIADEMLSFLMAAGEEARAAAAQLRPRRLGGGRARPSCERFGEVGAHRPRRGPRLLRLPVAVPGADRRRRRCSPCSAATPRPTTSIVDTLREAAPGTAVDTIDSALNEVLRGGRPAACSGSASCSRFITAPARPAPAIRALEAINETRRVGHLRPRQPDALWLTLALMVAVLVAFAALLVAGPLFGVDRRRRRARRHTSRTASRCCRYPVGLAALLLATCSLLYALGPAGTRRRLVEHLPGRRARRQLLWVLASVGFSLYVSNFGSYDATYGSLGAVIVLLIWIYVGSLGPAARARSLNVELAASGARQSDDASVTPARASTRLELRSFLDGADEFFDHLGDIDWPPWRSRSRFYLAHLLARTRPGRTCSRPPTPTSRSPTRKIAAAYLAGAGLNSFIPARVGDAVKIFLAKRSIRGSSYPAITSSFFVQSVFDTTAGILVFIYALTQGLLPAPPELPRPARVRDLLLGREPASS